MSCSSTSSIAGRFRAVAGLAMLLVALFARPTPAQVTVSQTWDQEYGEIFAQIGRAKGSDANRRAMIAQQSLDTQALALPEDVDPLDVVLRRTSVLVDYFKKQGWSSEFELGQYSAQMKKFQADAKSADPDTRRKLFDQVSELRRKIAFSNPLLNFDSIICMLENPGEARIIEQARAIWGGHSNGGGPLIIKNFKATPTLIKPLEGVKVSQGPWKDKELTGKFSGLELSYPGTGLVFAATAGSEVWHLFRFSLMDRQLVQLTDTPFDDFDPCVLPSGRIVFTSTRRGGVGRCLLTPQSLTYTLHSMEMDGSDITCLSYHETNEWAPSVANDGKIVYTRWDYVDRFWGTAHHFWQCFPDGRDPRNYHGNYPLPLSGVPEGTDPSQYGRGGLMNGRGLRPDAEINFRAIPDSAKFIATAVGHHEGFSGSLVMIDPRIPDDGMMSQVQRITPEYTFPEVEGGTHTYGTPWPLSEDFYLCNFNTGLYLLDRFGNRDLIYDPGPGPFRMRDPFPLRARPTPPVLPTMTWQGKRASLPDHQRAVISVMNVYTTDGPGKLPEGTKIKWMRIVQVIPQMLDDEFSRTSITHVCFADESLGRMALGMVPVEEDGSVYCEAPVGKNLYFQLLDEQGMAVQSMRSATYVHAGEHLSCLGCHEDKWKPDAPAESMPLALRRAPSKLIPEVSSGAMPFNYVQLVKKPVFDAKCVSCHEQHPNAPDMSYASLARFDLAFGCPGESGLGLLGGGGSRTTPGRFGASASGIMKSLKTRPEHKDLKLTADDLKRITLWLDLNSNEIGWIGRDRGLIAAQKNGEPVWPPIDVDPANPTGVEIGFPLRPSPGIQAAAVAER